MAKLSAAAHDELIERVEKATGPDRELDAAIAKAFGFNAWAGRLSYPAGDGRWFDFASSEVTGSIDAALALVERLLPGWRLCIDGIVGGRAEDVYLLGPEYKSDGSHPDQSSPAVAASTWPLAILSALLRALKQQDPANE